MSKLKIKPSHAFVIPVMLAIVASLIAALPTVENTGRYFGGGPVRQWLINTLLLPALPDSLSLTLVSWFEQGSVLVEWLMCAPVVALLCLGLTPFVQLALHAFKSTG